MQLVPRYHGPPVIDLDGVADDPAEAVIRQRTRLASAAERFSADDWATPSRCEGWSVQDVVEHLAGVNRYWALSVEQGLRGTPTRLLTTFDPVSVPAKMVEAARGVPASATLQSFVTSNDRLAELLTSIDGEDWSILAESPPGHVALRAVAAHALWDAWTHERDVLVPLSRVQDLESDEVEITLAYAAAIGPAFRTLAFNEGRVAVLGVVAHDPDLTLSVETGGVIRVRRGLDRSPTATIEGDAVELIEGLSARSTRPTIADGHGWLLDGLGDAFDAGSPPGEPVEAHPRP